MPRLSLYKYNDYKKYILDWIANEPNGGRGLRKSLADAIGCQTPFVTHVLSGHYHLSLEQAESCGRWLGLHEQDLELFLLLVLRQRAGTKELEHFFSRQIGRMREQGKVLKKRLKIGESLSLENQAIYYSSWHYSAIHMAVLLPGLSTADALQKYFGLSRQRVQIVLEFLLEQELLTETNGRLKVAKPVLHLDRHSPLLAQHHRNWRLKALDSISENSSEALHYSAVVSLSEEDYEGVQEQLAQLLEDIIGKIKPSKEEKLASLCIDWFSL